MYEQCVMSTCVVENHAVHFLWTQFLTFIFFGEKIAVDDNIVENFFLVKNRHFDRDVRRRMWVESNWNFEHILAGVDKEKMSTNFGQKYWKI